jgi:hypothetical protein
MTSITPLVDNKGSGPPNLHGKISSEISENFQFEQKKNNTLQAKELHDFLEHPATRFGTINFKENNDLSQNNKRSTQTTSFFDEDIEAKQPYVRLPAFNQLPADEEAQGNTLMKGLYNLMMAPNTAKDPSTSFKGGWGMSPPGLIISITGDAGGTPDLVPIYDEKFSKELAGIAAKTQAWLIDGGSQVRLTRLTTLLTFGIFFSFSLSALLITHITSTLPSFYHSLVGLSLP